MKNAAWQKFFSRTWMLLALLGGGALLLLARGGEEAYPTLSAARFDTETVVIDAGHGGEDGGAVSATGVAESGINLAIAKKLDLLFGLYGVRTELLRTEDISLHDSGTETLREKKASDLHNRVARIESVENATLISIHQNIPCHLCLLRTYCLKNLLISSSVAFTDPWAKKGLPPPRPFSAVFISFTNWRRSPSFSPMAYL